MKTRLIKTPLKELFLVEIDPHIDERGFVFEPWHKLDFKEAGLNVDFVQEVHSRSKANIIRGIHYHTEKSPIAKLIRCIVGSVFMVAVDLRKNSESYGKWHGIELSAENKKQLYLPVGFGVGFAVLSESAEILYKFTHYYDPSSDRAIRWDDPDLAIQWPYNNPILSERDKRASSFLEYKNSPDNL